MKKKNKKSTKTQRVPAVLKALEEAVGGKIDWSVKLPDGSGCCTMSVPLPKDHWLTKEGHNETPASLKGLVVSEEARGDLVKKVKEGARYAIRASTMNGKTEDFDPDAMVQNMIIGLLGYYPTLGTR